MLLPAQRNLFCPCGRGLPAIAGLCRPCSRAAAYSRQRFAGLRDQILERDGFRCRACGASGRLHVHHRQPGVNEPDLLITVCARCHVRLHRLLALRRWIPDLLAVLWAEQHPGRPRQLQFPLAA
ncbi:MAG: HNH endonuclease [Bryobacteraceae bacterium]